MAVVVAVGVSLAGRFSFWTAASLWAGDRVSVALGHLERLVAHERLHGAGIDAGHHEAAREGVAQIGEWSRRRSSRRSSGAETGSPGEIPYGARLRSSANARPASPWTAVPLLGRQLPDAGIVLAEEPHGANGIRVHKPIGGCDAETRFRNASSRLMLAGASLSARRFAPYLSTSPGTIWRSARRFPEHRSNRRHNAHGCGHCAASDGRDRGTPQ